MQARAIVLGVADGRARLGCVARSACDACRGRRGCALRLFGADREPSLEVEARDVSGTALETGQSVVVEIDDAGLLSGTARAFLPMLAGLLGGVALARAGTAGEGLAVAAGLIGMASGWLVSRRWLRRAPPGVRILQGGGGAGD
jgi:positive regulator of sigma E activity